MNLIPFIAAFTLASASLAQTTPAPPSQSSTQTLTSTSTLVLVPALVRDPSGSLVLGLTQSDFRVTDNGVVQPVTLSQIDLQPVSILILMQTGGAAPRQFHNYTRIPTMLDYMAGSAQHEAALVTFDSAPEDMWSFTSNTATLADAFNHPAEGDHGAALLDAVNYGIDLLSQRPPTRRRIILLLSQPHDDGSKVTSEQIVRRLGENNITILSIAFSPGKSWVKDQFTRPRHENAPYKMVNHDDLLHTFDLGTPLGVALKAMQQDAAAEIANLSGGEHMRFDDSRSLDQQMGDLANHIPNRYALSFRPTSATPGFHSLKVEVLGQPTPLNISARSGYWSSPASAR